MVIMPTTNTENKNSKPPMRLNTEELHDIILADDVKKFNELLQQKPTMLSIPMDRFYEIGGKTCIVWPIHLIARSNSPKDSSINR